MTSNYPYSTTSNFNMVAATPQQAAISNQNYHQLVSTASQIISTENGSQYIPNSTTAALNCMPTATTNLPNAQYSTISSQWLESTRQPQNIPPPPPIPNQQILPGGPWDLSTRQVQASTVVPAPVLNSSSYTQPPPPAHSNPPVKRPPGGPRRTSDTGLSPQEIERRRLRRERNRHAAARCRQRRVDITNSLTQETELLENEKSNLEEELNLLEEQKRQLEGILAGHRLTCEYDINDNTVPDFLMPTSPIISLSSGPVIKQEPIDTIETTQVDSVNNNLNSGVSDAITSFMSRPLTLGLTDSTSTSSMTAAATSTSFQHDVLETPSLCQIMSTGITIQTPSSGIPVTSALGGLFSDTTTTEALFTPTTITPMEFSRQLSTSSSCGEGRTSD